MDMRSKLCVFLGYTADHKGYNCLHLPTRRIYISRDVYFDENKFPFATSVGLPSSTHSTPTLPNSGPLHNSEPSSPHISLDPTSSLGPISHLHQNSSACPYRGR